MAFSLLITVASVYSQKVRLQTYASGRDSIPIAVIAFKNLNVATLTQNEPWKVIADDLRFSGRFNVVNYDKADTAVFIRDGIGISIDGTYAVSGNTISMECFLRDASSFEVLTGKEYRGDLKHVRNMAHRYANMVLDMLFGERGPFESKIVFVTDKGNVKHIAIMDYDGHAMRTLTSEGLVNIFPAFIDSNTIVWT